MRHKLIMGVTGAAVVMLVAGCGGATKTTASSAAAKSAAPTPTTASASPVDPNTANCSDVNDTMLKIRDIFDGWDIDKNMFSKSVARRLRDQATELYSLETKATGPAQAAIHSEAVAMVDLSIAIEGREVVAFGDASEEGNRSLAALRGTCNF
jgi:hypothetical protein